MNKEISVGLGAIWIRYAALVGIVLVALGVVDWLFMFFGIFMLLLPLLFVFAKGLENVSMVRSVSGKELREGDWLVDDVKVGKKVIRADWDGLSLENIDLLKRRRGIKIKDGLPFVPAFLIAFLGYVFLREWAMRILVGLI